MPEDGIALTKDTLAGIMLTFDDVADGIEAFRPRLHSLMRRCHHLLPGTEPD